MILNSLTGLLPVWLLRGSEIKSVRKGRASINEAYCLFKDDELWVRNMHIAEYDMATNWQHEPLRMRKLPAGKRITQTFIKGERTRLYHHSTEGVHV